MTTPLVAAGLLVALLGLALVLDRLWLEAAHVELTSASEAAALSAARALANDDRLHSDFDALLLANRALQAAADLSHKNLVAGGPVTLDLATDVQIGRYVDNSQASPQFLQTDFDATHVRVTAHRSHPRGNPVPLFLSGLTREPFGDVVAQAEAGLDNHIVGVRPFDGAPVPALPLALWRDDPTGQRTDTWRWAIEARRGNDDYGYDAETHHITTGADGLTELTLRSRSHSGSNDRVNLQLLDVGTGFDTDKLRHQFETGWSTADLEAWSGQLELNSAGVELTSIPTLESADREALERVVGEPRICLLYSLSQPVGTARYRTTCVKFVALRVLVVRDDSDGAAEVVVQPAVLTTRTALTDSEAAENRYIYRLTLTR